MRSAAFPMCCGASVLYEFGAPPFGSTATAVKKWWERQEEALVKNTTSLPGIALAILTQEQMKTWDWMLKKHNWKRVVRGFYNYNHGSNLTLYMFEAHPDSRVDMKDFIRGLKVEQD